MNIEFSKSHKILDGEGTKNLWKRNTTKSRMSKWKEKQTKSPDMHKREQMDLKRACWNIGDQKTNSQNRF